MKVKFNAPHTVANEQNGLTVRYAAAKRQLPRLRWYLLLLLVSAPLLYLAARIIIGVLWDSSPGFVTVPQAVLRAGLSGRVEVLVHEGDTVAAGAVVAKVRPLAGNEPALAARSATAPLLALDQAAALGRVDQSALALRLAREQQARMAQRLQVVNQLIREGAATLAERNQAEAQLAAAQSDVLRAQADAFGTQTALQRVRLEQQQPQAQPAPQAPAVVSDVLAPVGGTVIRTLALSQEWVAAGADLVQLQRQEDPEIRVFVSPADAQNARVGERAELRFLDGAKMSATVVRIEAEALRTPPERVGPLATRMQSIVAVLKPDQPLDPKHRINELPLDVRFTRFGF
jgi:multidrug resistance efflux pump